MLYIPDLSFLHDRQLINCDYIVMVNGKECSVCSCDVSAMPFNRFWPGYQRDKKQTEKAAFINLFSDEEVEIKVRYHGEKKDPIVRPLSRKISVHQEEGYIVFKLKENGNYVFEPCGEHFALHIFFNKPPKTCKKEDVTYYFGPGIHNPLLLDLKDGDSVYIHPEALVYTTVYAEGVKDIHVFGGGILNNSCQERVDGGYYPQYPYGNLRMWNARNITIEDVILVDSCEYVLSLFDCENILIDGVKIVGQWRYNTDGIDLVNCKNAMVKNTFIRSFDDGIAIKAIYDHDVCENIFVDNCVIWCGWGKTLELGLETAAKEYRNIHFRNCDLIHNSTGAMAISNGHYANIHDIFYENIRVEFQKTNRPQVLQNTDHDEYEWDGKPYMENLIKLMNWRMSSLYDHKIASRDEYGYTHNIMFKDIYVYCDYDVEKLNITINSESADVQMENIIMENIFLNNERIQTFDEFNLMCINAKNVVYNGEGRDF